MARRTRKPEPEKVAAQLDQRQLMAAAPKLQRRIDELQKLEQEEISSYDDPRTSAARMKLDDTLVSIFGADSLDYDRYQVHSLANMGPMTFGGGPTPPQQIIENYKGGIREAITKTQTALDMVDERIAENNHTEGTDNTPGPVPAAAIRLSRRVFVVHGHDGEAKVQVARFLEKLTLEPVILHEQPNTATIASDAPWRWFSSNTVSAASNCSHSAIIGLSSAMERHHFIVRLAAGQLPQVGVPGVVRMPPFLKIGVAIIDRCDAHQGRWGMVQCGGRDVQGDVQLS